MTMTLVKRDEITTSTYERELVVFCPNCKTLETLWFTSGRLMPALKFSQVNGDLYHDCGSDKPCRVYQM